MLQISTAQDFVNALEKTESLIELTAHMEELLREKGVAESKVSELRKFSRFRCFSFGLIEQTEESHQAFHREGRFKIIVRDISRGGFGIVTHDQWYPSQRVRLFLPTGISTCDTARARYHGPKCYEVGLTVRTFVKFADGS